MGLGAGTVEGLVSFAEAFRRRRVFVTGHTGFKGSWLTLWLHSLGAKVTGYSIDAPDDSMFRRAGLESTCESVMADVRDYDRLRAAVGAAEPEFVFHLAAQPLVLASYDDPLWTLSTNVMGTAHLLEALRTIGRPSTAVIVTSDKCYENQEWVYSYRESDPMGGHDLYSTSKGAAELVVAGYRRSFFAGGGAIRVATARAGNVIGGGDWSKDRIVPDSIRALRGGRPIEVRNPGAVRPWQHVLEPVSGYLLLAARMAEEGAPFCEAWNFGPAQEDSRTVAELVEQLIAAWGSGSWSSEKREQAHEAGTLRLSTDKAAARLGWRPRWTFAEAVARTVEWYKLDCTGAPGENLRELTHRQIVAFAEENSNGSRR